MRIPYVIAFSIIFCFSCKKGNENEEGEKISNIPVIELVSVSSFNINEFDDLTLEVKYIDGDGDLGSSDADVKSVFVTDSRNDIVHEYHLQPLAPLDETLTIEGELNIVVSNIILLDDTNSSETAEFTIQLIDRAGNESNLVSTDNIIINK